VSAPFLSVRGLSKRFARTRALDSVDLQVQPGELVVILGPTGAGKTTLLRILAGLETADEGSIEMEGEDVGRRPPAARDVALVFQNFSLYPSWTVRRNLEFPLRAPGQRLSREEISRRVSWAADLLRITPLLDRDSRRLSGGEMQRVAIGRAIVRRPRLFLMDEPLTNLDAKLREALRVELAALARQVKTPMLYVTHDQAEALSMAERIVVLSAGRVHQAGRPEEIYLRPNSPAVARQLGQPPINIVPVERRGDAWFTADGTRLCDAIPTSLEAALLGVRPEHIDPTGGSTPARVEVVEDTGPARVVLVRYGGSPWHILTARDFAVQPGDTIHPRIHPNRVMVWDPT
jgi:multiple sugar transport system ATP-binding protein